MSEMATYKRRLSNARRELRRAVERFSGVDPLKGHRVEALRLAREIKEAADELVAAAERKDT